VTEAAAAAAYLTEPVDLWVAVFVVFYAVVTGSLLFAARLP